MSTLEHVFWNVLGYSAMPVIFLVGFTTVAAVSIWGLALTVDKGK